MLAFLAALGNFGIPALLGIPARFLMLPTLVYQRVTSFASGGFAQAAALALVMAVPALLVLWLQVRLNRRATPRQPARGAAPLPARALALAARGARLAVVGGLR
jgi:iron(III) transport system permease protein